jgi:hypothetical protein
VSPVDYANTATAQANREAKAAALASAARALGIAPGGLTVGTGHRRTVWKAAGLTRSPSEDTWHVAAQLLATAAPALGQQQRPCRYGDGRPAHLYLGGWLCDEHAPWARTGGIPVPKPGTTLDDLRARRSQRLAAEEAERKSNPPAHIRRG